jgi:hypothetical protein
LTGVCVGVSLWSAVAPQGWRAFENSSGPLRALAGLALMLPVAELGWRRPLSAGVMLLVIGVAPLLAAGSAPLWVMAVPTVVIGALLLAAGLVESGHQDGTTSNGPPTLPTPHTA